MNRIPLPRRRAERFAQLLDEAESGRHHHADSSVEDELATLLAVAEQARAARPAPAVNPDFRARFRAELMTEATKQASTTAQRGAAAQRAATARQGTDTRTAGERPAPARPARRLLPVALNGQRLRARGAILVGVAAGAIALSGISAASENAVPGDPLYGMKRSTERAQLAFTGSDLSRGELFLGFARTRLAEAAELRGDVAGLAAVLDDMDADTRQGVRLLTSSAVQRDDGTALDAVNAFVADQRRAVSRLLDSVPRGQRERVRSSLLLLDDVQRRSDGLRESLDCPPREPVVRDQLGPRPYPCQTSDAVAPTPPAPTSSPPRHPGRQAEHARSVPGPSAAPSTAAPTAAARGGNGTAADAVVGAMSRRVDRATD